MGEMIRKKAPDFKTVSGEIQGHGPILAEMQEVYEVAMQSILSMNPLQIEVLSSRAESGRMEEVRAYVKLSYQMFLDQRKKREEEEGVSENAFQYLDFLFSRACGLEDVITGCVKKALIVMSRDCDGSGQSSF